jgi:ABC-2 type transport system permease protein
MLKLLKIEWMKIRNYRTFWILLGITIVSIPGFNYMLYEAMDNSFPKHRGKNVLLGSPFAFPDVWQTVAWNASLLFLIPSILVITLTTNEFTYKTHRQNIIDGWTRNQFIGVKLVEVLILSLLSTVVILLTCLAFGYIGNVKPANLSAWQDSRFLWFFFVESLSYTMIAFLLSILIKRAGLAMGVWFMYWIVEQVLVGFGRFNKVNIVDYLPEEVTDRLIPFPYAKNIIAQAGTWESHIPLYLTIAAVYLLIYCIFTSRYFLKSDL